MNHFLLLVVLAQLESMLVSLHEQYPLATLQDVYKTCYQDYFGAEHAAPDSVRAMQYLTYELSLMAEEAPSQMPKLERCGFRHDYERVSLSNITDSTMTAEQLLRDFLDAAATPPAHEISWAEEWGTIEQKAIEMVGEWQDEELQKSLREAAAGNKAVHHSVVFRETYRPHYRIRRTKK